MKKNGFASMYMIYSFFLIFVMLMFSTLMINNYKKTFLVTLKNDIKDELKNYSLEDYIYNDSDDALKNITQPT